MSEPGHLSDQTLNEYLDGVLPSRARAQAEAHLRSCEVCARRLGKFASLFAALDRLPEVPFEANLAPRIVDIIRSRAAQSRRSARRSSWRLGLALASEAVGALVILGLILPQGLSWLTPGAMSDFTGPIASVAEEVAVFFAAALATPDPLGLDAIWGRISAPSIPWASVSSLVTLLAGSTLVWLLGNGLLLRRGPLSANRRDG